MKIVQDLIVSYHNNTFWPKILWKKSPKSIYENSIFNRFSFLNFFRPVEKNLALDLTQLWSESHAESAVLGPNKNPQNSEDQEKAGKRYRSSIRIMVRPEVVERLQRPVRANSSDGFSRSSASSNSSESARSAKKLSAAGVKQVMSETMNSHGGEKQQRSIVKEQFR